MKALVLTAPRKLEPRDVPAPELLPHQVLIRSGAVGLCGTDFHIFEGHANYNADASGRLIPFEEQPQIMGHEFCGTVVEVGSLVKDLKPGDRVVADQGLNCLSRNDGATCEYCETGDSHQCARYSEHGITGLQGALAELVALAAVNTVKIESDLPLEQAVMSEPLGCITHTMEMVQRTSARYQFNGERPVKAALICGAGPAGLLFTQYLRNVLGFEGTLIVSEPNEKRRRLVTDFGATAIDPTSTNLVEAVNDLTHGERINFLIESAGVAPLFKQMPGLLRKQATVVLYGHGHHGVDLGVLNNVQFLEPSFVAPIGASGGFDVDGRPLTYRRSLHLIEQGRINVSKFITHRYTSLEAVPQGFAQDRFGDDYIKGIAVL